LEYKNYYEKLYDLLQINIFDAENNKKFLSLLEISLKSSKVPNIILCSFIKKLAKYYIYKRFCLILPVYQIFYLLSLIINLMVKHPGLTSMLDL
jgi:U3 small nucleolar RNA-associated protein 19